MIRNNLKTYEDVSINLEHHNLDKENNNVWLFANGGERTKMGYKFAFEPPMSVKLHGQNLPCWALSHLKAFYGPNFMTPIKKSDKEN